MGGLTVTVTAPTETTSLGPEEAGGADRLSEDVITEGAGCEDSGAALEGRLDRLELRLRLGDPAVVDVLDAVDDVPPSRSRRSAASR